MKKRSSIIISALLVIMVTIIVIAFVENQGLFFQGGLTPSGDNLWNNSNKTTESKSVNNSQPINSQSTEKHTQDTINITSPSTDSQHFNKPILVSDVLYTVNNVEITPNIGDLAVPYMPPDIFSLDKYGNFTNNEYTYIKVNMTIENKSSDIIESSLNNNTFICYDGNTIQSFLFFLLSSDYNKQNRGQNSFYHYKLNPNEKENITVGYAAESACLYKKYDLVLRFCPTGNSSLSGEIRLNDFITSGTLKGD